MTEYFVHDTYAQRIAFGRGAIRRLSKETAKLGVHRLLLLSTPGQAAAAKAVTVPLHNAVVGHYSGAVGHVPIEVVEDAIEEARHVDADGFLWRRLNHRPWKDPFTRSRPAAGDNPELSRNLPPDVSATSGINALAHAVEALYAANANPLTDLMATESIRALGEGLPAVIADPQSIDARERALFGAWLSGSALAATNMGIHYKLAHVLGGTFGLNHAAVHTVLLPHAAAYNRAVALRAMGLISKALGVDDAATGIFDLISGLGAPTALREIGLPATVLDQVASLATEKEIANPAPVTTEGVRLLLENA